MEIVGHLVGVLAIALNVISYQIAEKKKLLFCQTMAVIAICVQYLLIGAYSGFTLNVVCVLRNLCYYHRDKKIFSGLWLPVFFACAIVAVSLISWEGLYSIFILVGLVINTVCIGVCGVQNFRKSILITSPLVIVYNVFAHSYTGILSECLTIFSAAVGLIRYRKQKNTAAEGQAVSEQEEEK